MLHDPGKYYLRRREAALAGEMIDCRGNGPIAIIKAMFATDVPLPGARDRSPTVFAFSGLGFHGQKARTQRAPPHPTQSAFKDARDDVAPDVALYQ
jgi:hypothetical protein